MSDEKPIDDFLAQFDGEIVKAYSWLYDNKLIRDVKCPICGGDDWLPEMRTGVPDTVEIVTPVFAIRDPRAHWGAAPSIPTIALTCTSCGFIRQHNLAWLVRLVAQGALDG